ncbi:flavin reductase family protein [Kitasatospora sp. CB01950]|uniref:flavin reductase family protein n=1 Tax=Kitasatospora sp. CB01950 TaxID=1703930 RepID=UPI0009391BAA|nr:flavin reductase family protein [Kitasatospora sp. CB01950]OKJ16189.1 flavin reductase [Kitasatospora sp. CB01950]
MEPHILYFGTPVVLLSTVDAAGAVNLAPISSAWALDRTVVLGLGPDGRTSHNLAARPELVINVPGPQLWRQVERLGDTTGRPDAAHFVRDKFAHAGLTAQPAELVAPPRVAECPLQLEARVADLRADATGEFLVAEAHVLRVHAAESITVAGTDYVEPAAWSPLVYNFRHYFGLGPELGHSSRSRTPRRPTT